MYLYGREFILETDHQPLLYLNRAKVSNPRIMRWALALQPYRFTVRAIKGSDNLGADFLSRALPKLVKQNVFVFLIRGILSHICDSFETTHIGDTEF